MMLLGPLSQAGARPLWAGVDPRLKLALLATVSLLAVTLDQPRTLLPVLLTAVLLMLQLRLSWAGWRVILAIGTLVIWGTVLSQSLFYADRPRTPLVTLIEPGDYLGLRFSGLRLYREGLGHGLLQSMRMLSATFAGLAVALSTGPERLLAVMARFRPLSGVSFTVLAAVRFLPLVLTEWHQVQQARRLRGGPPAPLWRRPWAGMRDLLASLEPVLAGSLRRARSLATSVSARGFDPTSRRTAWPPLRMRWWERLALVGAAALALSALTARLALWVYDAGLFYHPLLRVVAPRLREWL